MRETEQGLSFREAVSATLSTAPEGIQLLEQPKRFLGVLLDLCDENSDELTLLTTCCEDALIQPFLEAAESGSPSELAAAAVKGTTYLGWPPHFIDHGHAQKLCEGLALGIADHLGLQIQGLPTEEPAPASPKRPVTQAPPISEPPRPTAQGNNNQPGWESAPASPASQTMQRPYHQQQQPGQQPPTPQQQPQPKRASGAVAALAVTAAIILVAALIYVLNSTGAQAGGDTTPARTPEEEVVEEEPRSPLEGAVDFLYSDGRTYALFDEDADWQAAESRCEALGGHLATINSQLEQNTIENLVYQGNRNVYWVGGYLAARDTWAWVSGESFSYTNWADGSPDNWVKEGEDFHATEAERNDVSTSENCIVMTRVKNPNAPQDLGEWNDLAGNGDCLGEAYFGLGNIGFVCEWDSIVE